jgi:DNA-directed RNA polymerase subunit RPC12/RpoP
MTAMSLEAHLSAPVEVDLCSACQVFWFDKYESLKLSPASTLQLMKLIGEHDGPGSPAISNTLKCPRCSMPLRSTNDIQRTTRFSYWRCGSEHGRLIRFFDFLKEKNFIRPMSAAQIEDLRKNVRSVNCSNCGAPIDLAESSACTHCGSAISMLDMNQAQQTLNQLQQAAVPRPIDPALPLELERAKREVNPPDLVQDVIAAIAKWLTK